MDCLFCRVMAGEVSVRKFYEDEEVVAFHDTSPQVPMHFLVIPKRHIPILEHLTEANRPLTGHIPLAAQRLAREQGCGEGLRVTVNCNDLSEQIVYHIHMYVLGQHQAYWPLGQAPAGTVTSQSVHDALLSAHFRQTDVTFRFRRCAMSADCHYSPTDRFLLQADSALRILLSSSNQSARPSSAIVEPDGGLSEEDTRYIAGLMRINHTSEVYAQALYQGQSPTARLPEVHEATEETAEGEIDHLAWCEQHTRQLGSHFSVLNPIFYGLSFGVGIAARLVSDRVSLDFVAAIKDQVYKYLDEHLTQIPQRDRKSRITFEQTRIDEGQHPGNALAAGGLYFLTPAKLGMSLLAKVMTENTCRI